MRFHLDERVITVNAARKVLPPYLALPASKHAPQAMHVDHVAQGEDVRQTHRDDGQGSFALHPLDICNGGPSEVVFEGGTSFGNGDQAPNGDNYNAIACA